MIKKCVSVIAVIAVTASMLPQSFAEETPEIKLGEYLDSQKIELLDENSRGVIAFPEYETMYDFDSDNLPSGMKAEKSEVSISDKFHGSTGAHSLKWTTSGEGSRLVFDSGTNLFHYWDSKKAVGIQIDWQSTWYITVGFLQEKMPDDGITRSFRVGLVSAGKEIETYNVYLHKEGWTILGNSVASPKNTVIDSIMITQTSGKGCDIYIDDIALYVRNNRALRSTPYSQSETLYSDNADNYPIHELTEEEKEAFKIIEERVMSDPEPIDKIPESEMEKFREYYKKWEIKTIDGTDLVNGYCPLYFHRAPPGNVVYNLDNYSMNKDYYYLCSTYKTLGATYKAVQDNEQKEELKKYVVDIAKLALTYSNVPDNWYAGEGFAEGCYYARDALAEAGLADKVAKQLKEQYAVDAILYSEHILEKPPIDRSTTSSLGPEFDWKIDADNAYNAASATMISILSDADSPEKARSLYLFKDYLDKLMMNYTPGTLGGLKPDGSIFHHSVNKYDYGWSQAWDGITKYIYWFSGTPFEPSEETLERINRISKIRYQDLGLDTRGGVPGHQAKGLGSKYTLRVAEAGTSDGELSINPYRASEYLAQGNSDESFAKMGIKPAKIPQTNITESYAMKNIHRRSGWRVQTYAQNSYCAFNEYARPATLFFNMGGIQIDVPGSWAAMLKKADDNIYGRDTFEPAEGYNFNRAPGVTAPDSNDKTKLASAGKGSSPYIGGVSTKNGNGVFMNQFDAADNQTEYAQTVASDFKFKKSYFYFDNMIVTLGSDIGYGGTEEVSTGIFQEKMTDNDEIKLAGDKNVSEGEYHETFSSNDVPWLSDNINQAMYYIFPNQEYTLTRGAQSFVFKEQSDNFKGVGDFVSAYINHPQSETLKGQGSYAYIIAPSAGTETMKNLEESMKSDNPRFEILQKDSGAHIVRDNSTASTGYVIFDKKAELADTEVKAVSASAVIMTKCYDGGMSVAVADPDLRISKTPSNPYGKSIPKDLTITLSGRWHIKEKAKYDALETVEPQISYNANGDTIITVECSDGLTNEYLLENVDNQLKSEVVRTISVNPEEETVLVDNKSVALDAPLITGNATAMIAAADIAKILNAEISWDSNLKSAELSGEDMVVSFTFNSKIAVKGNEIIIMSEKAIIKDDRLYVPTDVLRDILEANIIIDGNTVDYVEISADWKNWDKPPEAPTIPYLNTIEIPGYSIQYNKDIKEYTVEVPEETQVQPEVSFTLNENYSASVTEIGTLPGKKQITVIDKNDNLNISMYTIKFVYPNSSYKITASVTPQMENGAENVMDGDSKSYWACDTKGGYITFELPEPVMYSGVSMAFIAGDKRKAYFDIEVSEDGNNWTPVYQEAETSGTTLELEKYEFTPIKGRFIRIIGYGNSISQWFSLAEVEIHKKNL